MPAQGILWTKAQSLWETKWKMVWRGKLFRKNKGTQQREDAWHPLNPGTSLFPSGRGLLLEIGSTWPKLLRGIMNDPGWSWSAWPKAALTSKQHSLYKVLSGNLCERMQVLGHKVRDAVKCTWVNGHQHERDKPRVLGTDTSYRFK
jgi:hypothetical protein